MKHLNFLKSTWFLTLLAFILGALVILGIRFATYAVPETHYHANIAVYLNGQREAFKGPQYYQEVAACTAHGPIQPTQRAHLHDNINSVIHVHDEGVTWEQFFNNLGWSLGPNFIVTDKGTVYTADGDSKLNLVLNGQNLTDLTSLTNVVIRDRDRLLVSFGNIDSKTLQTEYNSVPATAKHYDETKDPSSCAGPDAITVSERLHHLF